MSDDRADVMLTLLREIRGEIATVRERQDELILRVSRVERETANLRMEIANLHGDFATLSVRLDNLDRRLAQLLELTSNIYDCMVDESTGSS